jgi:hypothetical protein
MELYASNDEELALLTRWQNWALETTAAIEAASTTEEKQRIAQEQNDENAELIKAVNKILDGPRANKVINGPVPRAATESRQTSA